MLAVSHAIRAGYATAALRSWEAMHSPILLCVFNDCYATHDPPSSWLELATLLQLLGTESITQRETVAHAY